MTPAALTGWSLIDEIVREGARRMLAEALQAEVDAYIAQFTGERDEHGRRLVVRNGSHRPREVLTSAGAVEVVAPRVNDRRVDPRRRRTPPVLLGDPAAVVPQDPEDHRGAAAAVPARASSSGLRARPGRVRRAGSEGIREEPVVKLRKRGTGSNLVDRGRGAVHDLPVGWVDFEADLACRWGGHGEGLRRSSWRCCRGKAGCRTDRSIHSEHGNRLRVAPARSGSTRNGGIDAVVC